MDHIESPVMQMWWSQESTTNQANTNHIAETPVSTESSGYASGGVANKNTSNSSHSTTSTADDRDHDVQEAVQMMDYLLTSKLTTTKSLFHKRIDEFVNIYSPMLQEMCNRLMAESETKFESISDLYSKSKHVFVGVMRQLYPPENGRTDRQNFGALIALCGFVVVYTDTVLELTNNQFDRAQIVTVFNQVLCETIAKDVHARSQLRKAVEMEHDDRPNTAQNSNSKFSYFYVPLSFFALAAVFLFLRRRS